MSQNLLKISLKRFEADRAFAQDVFLYLALNEKYLKIAVAGGELTASTLNRLSLKGVSDLYVATQGEQNLDPASFPLYDAKAEIGSLPSVPTQEAFTPSAEIGLPNHIPPPSPAEVAKAPDAEIRFSPDIPSAQVTQSFDAASSASLEELHFSAEKEVSAPSTLISGSDEKPEEKVQVFNNEAELESEGALILVKLRSALIAEKVVNEAESFCRKVASSPLKTRKTFRRDFSALSEAADRVANDQIDALTERKFKIEKELAPFLSLASKASEETLVAASDRIIVALKNLPAGYEQLKEAKRLIEESEQLRESVALTKLAKRIEKAPETETQKTELINDVKNTLMVNKISEEILKFSNDKPEKEMEQRFSPELASLERALETVSSGGTLPKEVELRFAADKEAEEMVTIFSSANNDADAGKNISQHIKIAADRREEALQELDNHKTDGNLIRAKSHRDLPNTASRLAAYLGYSLGYTDHAFLSDLALTAVLHFARKEEMNISTEGIPPFVKSLLNNEAASDFVAQDSCEIIQVLDAYLSNPDCDRDRKDFAKRIFDRTLDALLQDQKNFDAVNVAKWSKFMDRGPDLQGHSICVKASANAVKQSKSIII